MIITYNDMDCICMVYEYVIKKYNVAKVIIECVRERETER